MGWTNVAGAVIAATIYATSIAVFVSRLAGRPEVGHAVGWAQLAGRGWTWASGVLFLLMAILTFVQHTVTGA